MEFALLCRISSEDSLCIDYPGGMYHLALGGLGYGLLSCMGLRLVHTISLRKGNSFGYFTCLYCMVYE